LIYEELQMNYSTDQSRKLAESELNSLSSQVIGACIQVHRSLGPGLLESVYHTCLCYELGRRGLGYQKEASIPIRYGEIVLESKLRADLIVENAIIVEVKSVKDLIPLFEAQLMTYLSLSNIELGLLINFNVPLLKNGIQRIRMNMGRISNDEINHLLADD